MRGLFTFFFVGALVCTSACAPVGKSISQIEAASVPQSIVEPDPVVELGLCSALDFTGITWSKALPGLQREMLALALNITGSFEGESSWSSLAGNFDGQGLSMGLLQQNLGQGTLQPMWLDVLSASPGLMQAIFSADNFKSLFAMMNVWKTTMSATVMQMRDFGYSELDDVSRVAHGLGVEVAALEKVQSALTTRNQASVDWAVQTLYTGGQFKSDWKLQLAELALTSNYRSLQVARAEKLHNSAMALLRTFNMRELRSYLFFFDITVQNGGISSSVRDSYFSWERTHAGLSESDKLLWLLELRLATVNPKYVGDVRARKSALINGRGLVHGQARSFQDEYCISLGQTVPL